MDAGLSMSNFSLDDARLPSRSAANTSVLVDIEGAEIVDEDPARETRDIYLPRHTEFISHIALDIGGSLAKVVYFTRVPHKKLQGTKLEYDCPGPAEQSASTSATSGSKGLVNGKSIASLGSAIEDEPPRPPSPFKPNGILGPKALQKQAEQAMPARGHFASPTSRVKPGMMKRRASVTELPGGRLNFIKFETDKLDDCIKFIKDLIESSSRSHGVALDEMKKGVKIMATGGGSYLFYERLRAELGVDVTKEEEMDCLITGLTFITEIPNEVFWYSDELLPQSADTDEEPKQAQEVRRKLSDPIPSPEASVPLDSEMRPDPLPIEALPRPSANPPMYSLLFDSHPTPHFPCMLVNIGSGVSIIKVDDYGKFERISGTSLGGGTLWGLLSIITGAESFDEMLAMSEKGDNAYVDMLVGDIYGSDYSKIGLKSTTIASSFGKVFRKGRQKQDFKPEDISRSLLYAISNNIGQIAYMNAEKHGLDRIYFGGCFIRGHAATISTLSYAIRFWSKGTKKALFLRHEGYLGSIGAWLKNIEQETGSTLDRIMLVFVSLLALASSASVYAASPALPIGFSISRRSQPMIPFDRALVRDVPDALTIDMPINHFPGDPKYQPTNETFKLRYFVNADHYKPGGAVLIWNAGEGSADDQTAAIFSNRTFIYNLTQSTNSVGIVLEHRYYGKSIPMPSFSTDDLQYLTVEQALADWEYFAKNAELPTLPQLITQNKAPLIYLGASYSGALAAWQSVVYPTTFWGYIASSAVTVSILDFAAYVNPVRDFAPRDCVANLSAALDLIDTTSESMRKPLQSIFGLPQDQLEFVDFVNVLAEGPLEWQSSSGNQREFSAFCDAISTGDGVQASDTLLEESGLAAASEPARSAVLRYASYITNRTLTDCEDGNLNKCFGTNNATDLQLADLDQDWRLWAWQTCSQMAFFMTGNVPTGEAAIMSKHIDLAYYKRVCQTTFPPGTFNKLPEVPDMASVLKYGGYGIRHPRLAFVDGTEDPWRPCTPHADAAPPRISTTDEPYLLVQGGVHGADFGGRYGPNQTATNNEARATELSILQSWIADWQRLHQ
ncbi:uncharacterized protein L969DRAFT_91764 [Mixia osmundae IAM 14324]|uniref:Uncharacterized protein n=1 Tax=Mixia osmundae (strain CBS 9802 / IAM 14324 / JCM 22182 / KY 12970) TaxID=764103 RepID=G7EAG3_MIXOS|nr:uncharacterized protein L969DRAFT_91764 [Mixia osmundae IAM 14324]KEI42313.1 hypothetical protein L969DRAFT_91764 [Mixia osmundae IAM 14324]GAA99823.1 hypothetical protein E5Q_06526 [Mixia osmundae IAM 14324]